MSKFVCINCWIPTVGIGAQWHKGEGPLCGECYTAKSKPVGAVTIFPPVEKKGKK